ncbi:secretory pathway Sec39 [Byssothecium circinans]|uniref:Secretory pathway Sec39 n=1 Tax=Byssothecium circinans TaxID=147558 RepID=A0A6A5U395_9PLEO|nr:secretory pathway Sec39 [Byssothecium circinans]
MGDLQKLERLSESHCVLLAVHYATESNINALRALTSLRENAFSIELVLQILLTYLSESVDPSLYLEYLDELGNNARSPGDDPAAALDVSAVQELSNSKAQKKRRKIELLQLAHPLYRAEPELDPLTHFLIHRAHRIDAETGLLDLTPQLLVPFLHHSEYLRIWYISTVLPLLRLAYEYYPQMSTPSLDEFARLKGRHAIDLQLSNLRPAYGNTVARENAARDLRGVVGPWICGANERKRRKLSTEDRRASVSETASQEHDDWESLFEWLVHTSKTDLPLVSTAMAEWDGPEDMDLGGYEEGRSYLNEETQRKLEIRYAQTALSCLYLVDNASPEIIQTAHGLLGRISDLLNLEPPPALNVVVSALPTYDLTRGFLEEVSPSSLQEDRISRPENHLTQPSPDTVRLLELLLFSSCILSSLQQNFSIREVARMYVRNDAAEQSSLLQRTVHTLSTSGRLDGEQWKATRAKLLWLWNWGSPQAEGSRYGQGILGNISDKTIETEILKGLLESSQYALASQIFIQSPYGQPPLPVSDVENAIITAAMHHYDNASNGNKLRGGMKRAFDVVSAFQSHFQDSSRFQRIQALISATHAMSFYSLTLQHGVPFQPVNIRVSADPLSLIHKLLSQNSRSYTHLDDMISIGQNLTIAMPSTLMDGDAEAIQLDPATVERKKAAAERRVIGMTVEAALAEDDFETAYSYVVNRLTPGTPSPTVSPAISTSSQRFSFGSFDSDKTEDDSENVAWRAALQAGRHSSSPSTSMSWGQSTVARPDLRRLEQRMELLSQALLLAPPRHLEEVLAVWQECEKEMTSLLAEENEAEERFNDAADRRLPGAFANDTIAVQPRREVGRGAVEESPMGLFDVARGAAAVFSKTAFPLRGAAGNNRAVSGHESRDMSDSGRVSLDLSDSGSMSGGDDRVRKRDMVANAVTGGLASGLGWVLGANPVPNRE